MEVLSDIPSVTYEYYQNNIKPKPEKVGKTEDGQTIWYNGSVVKTKIKDFYNEPICMVVGG